MIDRSSHLDRGQGFQGLSISHKNTLSNKGLTYEHSDHLCADQSLKTMKLHLLLIDSFHNLSQGTNIIFPLTALKGLYQLQY